MTFRDGVQLSFPLFDDRLRGAHFTLALLQQGTGGGNRAFGLFNLRNRLQPLLLQHAGIHFRQHLALTNELPFRNEDGINTPGNLSGNIHFGGFNSAVAGGKPSGIPAGRSIHRAIAATATRIPAPHHTR